MEAKNYEDSNCCCEVKKNEPSLTARLSHIIVKLDQVDGTLINIQRCFDGEERVVDPFPSPKCLNDDLYNLGLLSETILLRVTDIYNKISG